MSKPRIIYQQPPRVPTIQEMRDALKKYQNKHGKCT